MSLLKGINWNDITRVDAPKNLKRPVCKTAIDQQH